MKPETLPKIACSTIVRATTEGEEHGGLYVVDLNADTVRKVYSETAKGISWEGRGGDRYPPGRRSHP